MRELRAAVLGHSFGRSITPQNSNDAFAVNNHIRN